MGESCNLSHATLCDEDCFSSDFYAGVVLLLKKGRQLHCRIFSSGNLS